MDDRILLAKQQLLAVQDRLCSLYPGLISVGSPFYIQKRSRIVTRLIFNTGATRCSAVSKLLLEASLGRCLVGKETCDHIDGNSLNDSLTNLQVLSLSDNARKGPNEAVRKAVSCFNRERMRGIPCLHSRGEANGRSKLTDAQAQEIREKSVPYIRGMDKKLALEYGVSRELISGIRRGVSRAGYLDEMASMSLRDYPKYVSPICQELPTWSVCKEKQPKKPRVRKKSVKVPKEPKPSHYCSQCGVLLTQKQRKYCSYACLHLAQRKVERPSLDIIQQHIDAGLPMTKIGAMYGVSDKAIRKWLVNRT